MKLSRGPETLSADGIPHTTVGPLGLETDGRDVMSDGSSEGSSQADETLFCGISTCARLCEAVTCLDIGRVQVLFLCKSLTVWAHVFPPPFSLSLFLSPRSFECSRCSCLGGGAAE